MPEKKSHSRVLLNEIRENPANGVYVTNTEIRKISLYAGVLFLILMILAVFDRKK